MQLFNRLKGLRLVNVNNLFRRAMYGLFIGGTDLDRSSYTLSDDVKENYGKNPTVFGMINKLARMAANVRLIPMKGETESEFDPMLEIFSENDADYTYEEFRMHWFCFAYALGESIVYWPTFSGGNNLGQLIDQPDIIPSQNIDIESAGYRNMVNYYKIDINSADKRVFMESKDVWHSRLFLNLDFTNGKNFRGVAPISVAADVIRAMSEINKTIYKTVKRGFPPGIFGNKSIDNTKTSEEFQEYLERQWSQKFEGSENRGRPIIAGGDLYWFPIGFSNFRDLQIIESSSMGRSVLCNTWGVPEELFSSERSTLDNKNTARKLAYEDSIIPMLKVYISGLNKRTEKSYGITYKIDEKSIPAMQEDKLKIAQTMKIGRDARAITKNEFRQAIGLEFINDPEFDIEGLIDEGNMPEQFQNYQQNQNL